MVELGARILLSGGLLFIAGAFRVLDFDLAWKAALALLALGVFAHRLDVRGLRNAGVAGFIAVADAFLVAALLGASGSLVPLGALVLVPCVWAARQHGASVGAMAPLAAAGLLGSHALFSGSEPPPALLAAAAAVLAVGLLSDRRSSSVESVVPHSAPPTIEADDDALLSLRDRFRSLRDAYGDLERRGKRDRVAAALLEATYAEGEHAYHAVAERIAEAVGVKAAVVHTVAGYDRALVVRGVAGDLPPALGESALDVDVREAPGVVRAKAEAAVRAVGAGTDSANVLLTHQGRPIGLLALVDDSQDTLEKAKLTLEGVSESIAAAVVAAGERQDARRRLREAEILYGLATAEEGSVSRTEAASRLAREVRGATGADHVGVFLVESGTARPLAQAGVECRLIESMSFASGPGIGGWLGIDAPELLLFDARDDGRCAGGLALRARIGSYVVVPLFDGAEAIGFVSAATARVGGLDLSDAETLRATAAELERAFLRLQGRQVRGVISPTEVFKAIERQSGPLVVLEPLRRASLVERFGAPAIEHAVARFARRVRARLPEGGALCRRPEGDLVAHLPGLSVEEASRWANEIAATASLLGLRTPDGSTAIPFAVRARVAQPNQQKDEDSVHLNEKADEPDIFGDFLALS